MAEHGPSRRSSLLRADVPAQARWIRLVAAAIRCTHDLPTVRAWARQVGMSETQLRVCCRLAQVPAKSSLDLARSLRAAHWAVQTGVEIEAYLDIADPRTGRRLLSRLGLGGARSASTDEYLQAQQIVTDPVLVQELRRVVARMTASADPQ